MNDIELNKLLKGLAAEPRPSLRGDLAQGVWREIRLRREKDSSSTFWTWFLNPWTMPRFALAGLAAALFVGLSLGAMGKQTSPALITRAAFDLEVFSDVAPNLPSSLLAQKR